MENDLISRQAAIDIERDATVDTNPSHFEAHQKFTQFIDDAEISSFGRWQWSNGFNTALTAVRIDLQKLPSAQPEPEERTAETAQNVPKKDLISRKAAIDAVNGVIADYIPNLYGRYEALPLEMATALKRLPTAEPTLYGYNIKHLAFVATVMEKEGVTAEYAVRTFGDISRASRMIIEELQEKVEKSLSAMQLSSVEPEIIQCKDCRYTDEYGVCQSSKGLATQDDDDFCSHAERRGG